MRVLVILDGSKRRLALPAGSCLRDAAGKCGLGGQTAIMMLNGLVSHPSTALSEGDSLELVPVIYGG